MNTQELPARSVLKTTFGYDSFRNPQEEIIETLLQGNDAFVLMPTGGGKSLCYQIPALLLDGITVVVSPLIALMQDQVDALRQLGVRAAFLNSSLNRVECNAIEQQLLDNALDIVYLAPERLLSEHTLALLDRCQLALFAIDEAHCVSQWGHDFRIEYQQLKTLHDRYPHIPRIALTATADQRTREEIISQLGLEQARLFINSFDRPNITYAISEGENPRRRLWDFLSARHAEDAGIVYCLSRRKVESTAEWLNQQGRLALPYHAGMSSEERQRNQERFLREDSLIMVATIAFGMGIDKPDVRFVAHLSLPKSIEAYYQETGRAGRDGEPANAWMAYGLQDVITLRQFTADSGASEIQKRIAHQKLEAMLGLCETTGCRRHGLLTYFDEQPSGWKQPEHCGNCDNCLQAPEQWDATVAAQKALSCIYRTGQRFGVAYLTDILLGKADDRVLANQHNKISTFGIGTEFSNAQWRSIYRQLIALGFVTVASDGYGALKLTERSRPVLRGEQSLAMRKQPAAVKSTSEAKEKTSIPPQHQALWEALRAVRSELAAEHGVPPYVIFHDATLKEMLQRRPATLADMAHISGIGALKLKRYGQRFLDAIESHPLPELLNNQLSDTVNESLMLLQEGIGVDDIALQRDIKASTVYSHLAEAISLGLLDARGALSLDEAEYQRLVQVIEHFGEAAEGRLKPAYEALEGQYDYGILKCVQAALSG